MKRYIEMGFFSVWCDDEDQEFLKPFLKKAAEAINAAAANLFLAEAELSSDERNSLYEKGKCFTQKEIRAWKKYVDEIAVFDEMCLERHYEYQTIGNLERESFRGMAKYVSRKAVKNCKRRFCDRDLQEFGSNK